LLVNHFLSDHLHENVGFNLFLFALPTPHQATLTIISLCIVSTFHMATTTTKANLMSFSNYLSITVKMCAQGKKGKERA
jgi:hypothetical protein